MGVKNLLGITRRLAMYAGVIYWVGGFIPPLSDGVRLILFKYHIGWVWCQKGGACTQGTLDLLRLTLPVVENMSTFWAERYVRYFQARGAPNPLARSCFSTDITSRYDQIQIRLCHSERQTGQWWMKEVRARSVYQSVYNQYTIRRGRLIIF